MFNSKQDRFDKCLTSIFNTEEGKEVLAVWKAQFVDNTAVRDSELLTGYALGQKEFVLDLIDCLDDASDLNHKLNELYK